MKHRVGELDPPAPTPGFGLDLLARQCVMDEDDLPGIARDDGSAVGRWTGDQSHRIQ